MALQFSGRAAALVFVATLAFPAHADTMVSQAQDMESFRMAFCEAPRAGEHIFVLPVSIFKDNTSFDCDDGTYGLRTSEPADDPGHMLFNVDPPHGSETSLDCDGKADIGVTMVAINCIPVSEESADHSKT